MKGSIGYASIPYDDVLARTTYLTQLPMLAECLILERFCSELETLLTSIAPHSRFVTKFTEVFPSVLSYLTIDGRYRVIYLAGEKLCCGADESVRQDYLCTSESLLQNLGQIDKEFRDFLVPQLDLSGPRTGKFAVWRLARLSALVPDFGPYQDALFQVFAKQDITNACEWLRCMKKEVAMAYLPKALMAASAQAHVYAINAIEELDIGTDQELTNMCLMNETEPVVLQRLVELPPRMMSCAMVTKLLGSDCVAQKAASVALASPHFEELLPKLIEQGGAGCELNCVNFKILKNCKPIPYDFLAMLIKGSKEMVKPETVEAIVSLDRDEILYKLVFPRMGEEGSWRSRYNAVEIFRKIVEKTSNWDSEEQQLRVSEYAGFLVAMCLDHVYAVREAALETLNCLPHGETRTSVLNSLFSLAGDDLDDGQVSILRQVLSKGRPAIVESCDKEQVVSIMKLVNVDEPGYFDLKQ